MVLVRRVVEQAAASGGEAGAGQGDPGLAYSRLSRAVRLTLALESRLCEPAEARHAADPRAEAERRRRIGRNIDAVVGQGDVEDALEDLIEEERGVRGEAEIENLLCDLDERLSELEEDDFADAPVSAIVARICADLGLTPDWDLWASEDWAVAEAREQLVGSPYGPPGPPVQTAGRDGAAPVPSLDFEAARATGPP